MIQPNEMKLGLPMELTNGVLSTTTKVWEILTASSVGDLDKVKQLVKDCPELIYAQYNYTPPVHLAVREGHIAVVDYLLQQGAHDPGYRIYPFLDSLQTIATDRGYLEIAALLTRYSANPSLQKYSGDNGKICFNRTASQLKFEKAVDRGDLSATEIVLKEHPEYALDDTYFWGEGILMKPAKIADFKMIELLMLYGAKVPDILKWPQFYYFERYDSAKFMIENGMNPNVMSWHHVTILHDMAQKGFVEKAKLLVEHGVTIDPIEEEYQSTPLGMAARWGHIEMVKYLLEQGADPNRSGAEWSTPMAWALSKGHTEIVNLLRQFGVV